MSTARYFFVLWLLPFIALSDQAPWDKWYLDHAYARHKDWLVWTDNGKCFMLQQHDGIAADLIVRGDDDSVNLNGARLWKTITYQVDIGNLFTMKRVTLAKPGYIVLPDASINMLKLASRLDVAIDYGQGERKESYSLMGFTKAYQSMVECVNKSN